MAGDKVTKALIVRRISLMQEDGMNVGLNHENGRFRVESKDSTRLLSPNMGKRSILDWLDAYEQGWNARGKFEDSIYKDMHQ